MNPELVKFHLPTTDQFSVAVDINERGHVGGSDLAGRCLRIETRAQVRGADGLHAAKLST
jgi:hypothetical protein